MILLWVLEFSLNRAWKSFEKFNASQCVRILKYKTLLFLIGLCDEVRFTNLHERLLLLLR